MSRKQEQVRKNLMKLRSQITDTIDKICEESEFEITYMEIHQALIDTMNDYNRHPLKSIWSEDLNE
jgi:hypothetical protein